MANLFFTGCVFTLILDSVPARQTVREEDLIHVGEVPLPCQSTLQTKLEERQTSGTNADVAPGSKNDRPYEPVVQFDTKNRAGPSLPEFGGFLELQIEQVEAWRGKAVGKVMGDDGASFLRSTTVQ